MSTLFLPFTAGVAIGILVIIVLLAASALISGSEVAFFSMGPKEKNSLDGHTSRSGKRILHLLGRPEYLLATILVTNNLVNVGIIILSTWVANSVVDFSTIPLLGFIVQTILITFVILLVGEIVPKVYATRYALRFARVMSGPVTLLEILFRPASKILIRFTSLVSKRFREPSSSLSMDQLSHALELTGDELLDEEQILKGIVKFGNIDVNQIMRPRVDMVAVEIKTVFSDLLNRLIESGYSRIPVYVNDHDTIQGVLFAKDLIPHIHKPGSFRWQTLIRPPYFVPENKKISDLLAEFQQNKIHLAIVVDEYGGTAGLITLEDILEEIVGEISDESDEEVQLYSKVGDNSYLFSGKTSLHDLTKVLMLEDGFFDKIRGESETLAGLFLEYKGDMPAKGEKIVYRDYTFIVRSRDERRLKEILVVVPSTKRGKTYR